MKVTILLATALLFAWSLGVDAAPPKGKPGRAAKQAKAKPGRMVNGHYMLFDQLDSLRVWKILPRATPPAGEGC